MCKAFSSLSRVYCHSLVFVGILILILSFSSVISGQDLSVRVILRVGEVSGPGGIPVKHGAVLGDG